MSSSAWQQWGGESLGESRAVTAAFGSMSRQQIENRGCLNQLGSSMLWRSASSAASTGITLSFLALFFHQRHNDNGHFIPSLIPLQFSVYLILLPITQCYKKRGVLAASGWIHLPPVCLLFSPARLVPQMSHIHPLNWQFYFSLFCVLLLLPQTICGIKEHQCLWELINMFLLFAELFLFLGDGVQTVSHLKFDTLTWI